MAKLTPVIAVSVVLMVLCALLQGWWTERWYVRGSELLDSFGARLEHIPLNFGDWQGVLLPGASETEVKIAQFTAERAVDYTNRRSGERVQMSIVCGLGRHVSVHTPDRCFRGAGYNLGESIQTFLVEPRVTGASAASAVNLNSEFYTSMFTKESSTDTERLRVLWSWNDGSKWAAPWMQKIVHARTPALYKLYLISRMPAGLAEKTQDSAAVHFAEDFIPVLQTALFPSQAEGAPAQAPATAQAAVAR